LTQLLFKLPAFHNTIAGRTKRGEVLGQLAAIAMTVASVVLRFLLDPMLPPGFPYLTFFPVVIITGFVWGIYPALTAALLSGCAAWYWFIPPFGSFAVNVQSVTALIFYAIVVGVDIVLLQLALHTAGSQVRARQALASALQFQQVVAQEVDHRLKNLLATVSGLISLSQKHAATPADLATQLRHRVNAMSHSIALLRDTAQGVKAGLREAALASLLPLGIRDGERLHLDGGTEALTANGIIPLNMIFHELGTNAVKYGALSNEDGSVRIQWRVNGAEDGRRLLEIVWTEQDGPSVVQPTHSGFGTELLTRMARSMGGGTAFDYRASGLVATITMDCTNTLIMAD
jgi:two-component sensor histidine kinase